MLEPDGEIQLYHAPVDLRKSYHRLSEFVEQELGKDSRDGSCYVFVNRQKTLCKVLWWDRTGWCLLTKRLSASKYRVSGSKCLTKLEINKKRYFFDGL